jgi:hypothetical protein
MKFRSLSPLERNTAGMLLIAALLMEWYSHYLKRRTSSPARRLMPRIGN